ncbi:MAG: N-acetyltransferase [Planctomycetes bacterium]|nr:N-acetyltransferase [Planctomycetota bacterium]
MEAPVNLRPPVNLRRGALADLDAILAIYNHFVEHTPITFDLQLQTRAMREPWIQGFRSTGPYQLFVAEDASELVGYAHSSQFRTKAAYDSSVETTVYLRPGCEGRGIGRRLYTRLFQAISEAGVHRAYAGITLPNDPSIALHRAFGFEPCGTWTEVGHKFDRFWDVSFWQKAVGGVATSASAGSP